MDNHDPIERQLEKLFSDAASSASGHASPPAPPPITAATQPETDAAALVKSRTTARRTGRPWNWRRHLGRFSEFLSAGAVLGWVLVVALVFVRQRVSAHPSGTAAAAVVSGGSRTPPVRETATATPTAPGTATRTPTDEASDRGATSMPTVSPSPTPTDANTATPTVTPTPTSTPTPTLSRVQPVHPATATPVSAQAIGLSEIPTPVPLVPMPESAINIVLLGSDQRPYETWWRTDVVIVVSVNPDAPSVSMLSIPRDTWLYVPNWTYQRINLADTHGESVNYPGGGPGLVKATIEYNFGIHVDYFARVDFAGLMDLVDTLGGIDVLLDCPVEDGFPDDPITEDPSVVTQISYPEPGLYHIDGKHALWLARSRKTTSEFARSRRQHRILLGMWSKAKQLGLVTRIPELWEDLAAMVETDLSLEQVLWLASVGLKIEPAQIHNGFIDGRHLTAWVSPGGANVLLPHTEAILEAMEPLFNPYPYQAPQGLSRVAVWNGSGHADWGLLAADKLLRNGFEVVEIRESETLYEKSMILDFTTISKGSPLPLLQRLFDADTAHASAEATDGISFRLIVGADYQPCEWPTPASWTPPTPTPTGDAAGQN